MTPRRSWIARALAALLIRGAEAPFVLRDLDDAREQDLARGLTPGQVRRRDLVNIVASAASLWTDRFRPSTWRPSWIDVRLGVRMLGRHPGLTAVAVFALALGIPTGLAPMHVVDALEGHLPEDPNGRLRMLCYTRDSVHAEATMGDFALWRSSLRSFDAMAAFRSGEFNLDPDDAVASVRGLETTASIFDVLGTPPLLGRTLRPADESPGAAAVVVIGHDLWQTRFGGDPAVIGRSVRVGGVPHAIVGVMPEGFLFPARHQVWLPLADRAGVEPREGTEVRILGRLADGVAAADAKAEVAALTRSVAARDPEAFERLRPSVLPTWHLMFGFPAEGGLRSLPEFYPLQFALLLPLLVACVNVGLLIFARTATRASEFAVRTALGASRARILIQVFTESLVLAVIASGAGLLILGWLPGRLMTMVGLTLPYWIDPRLTLATVIRALALAAGSAAIAGVVPALRLTGASIQRNIQRARARRSGVRFGGLSSALIVIDVAVAIVAIGFAAGVWGKIQSTRPNEAMDGIRAAEYLSATLDVSGAPGDSAADRERRAARTQAGLVERLRAEPGVRAATFGTALPRMDHRIRYIEIEAPDGSVDATPRQVAMARVATDFFTELGRPILAGRAFESRDLSAEVRSVIINTTLVDHAFGGRSPIGRRVRYVTRDGAPAGPWLDVVGVVGRLGAHALTPDRDDGLYEPLAPGAVNPVRLAIHTTGDPAALAPRVRALALDVDPRAVVSAFTPLDRVYEQDWYVLGLIELGGVLLVGVLLSLAASALYAILSFTVTERTREIGIRVALGADPWRVARHVARRAILQVGLGVLIGLPLAGRLMFEFLEVSGFEPSTGTAVFLALAQGAAVLVVVSLAACTVPTLRALRIMPVEALRGDG
ncbi:MAG: ABC transporter permease [Vicinamibacterales bacterium]